MSRVSESEGREAERVLYRLYRDWVDGEVEALADAVFRDEIDSAEALWERLDENTDSSLIYTHDQRMVLFVSESVDEGEQEMEDMGGGGGNVTAVLALLTYRVDVRDAMERAGLDHDFDRIEWIKAVAKGEHGEELAVQWDKYLQQGGTPLESEE